MRRGNNPKRSRNGRPSNRQPSGTRSLESNGPEGGKHRGNAGQLFERYSVLAREAQSAGDRVATEGYLQYAEHYLRVLNAKRANGRLQGNGQDSGAEANRGNGGDQSEPAAAPSVSEAAAEPGNSREDAEDDPVEPESAVN